ncbi:MAG: ATP-dependent helicase, partial [Candidatus Parcubacteria bacterium]|nr:ATP-dependent helicase [Candidatus Parcubacteria bacterium]
SEYEIYLKANFENAKDRIEDLNQLANFALQYEKLENFLSDVTLSQSFKGEQIEGYQEGPDEALVLSTIHQAKGLEWKYVFLMGLVEGQFPHYKIYDHPEEIEEERRLFYVAVTRAKDELYLTYPIISFSFTTGENINKPSSFISELDDNLFEPWQVNENGESYDDDQEDIIDYDKPARLGSSHTLRDGGEIDNASRGRDKKLRKHEFLRSITYDDLEE